MSGSRETTDTRPVVVIGGSRGTGLLIACRLSERGVPVRVLSRRPDKARDRLPEPITLAAGDLTRRDSLSGPLSDARQVIVTAGVRSGRPAREGLIRRTEYEGMVNVLDVLGESMFGGRFMYMTASGSVTGSIAGRLLNLYKGNTLVWRRRTEIAIRTRGLDYTIVRAGVLLNRAGGKHDLTVTQTDLPLTLRYRISRADVADVFVAALDHPRAARTTFDVVWGKGPRSRDWQLDLESLRTDEQLGR